METEEPAENEPVVSEPVPNEGNTNIEPGLFVCLCVCLFVCLFVCLSVCLFVYILFLCSFVRLFVLRFCRNLHDSSCHLILRSKRKLSNSQKINSQNVNEFHSTQTNYKFH